MRFWVVGLPWEPEPQCAYSGKVSRFCTMMRDRGHVVFEVKPDLLDPTHEFNPDSLAWRALNAKAIAEIGDHAEPHDFICLIGGRCQAEIATAFPQLLSVEFGIGYGGVIDSAFHVFESYAWMHTVFGSQTGGDAHRADGRFFDTVIPNYFDPAEFPEGKGDGGYFLYVGRLIERKGVQIASEVCERLGARLIIAGEGDFRPGYGEYVGVVGAERRAELMGGATAILTPTRYLEPFGGVVVEAALTGTPAITPDYGAFTETVEDGRTGFRCHTLGEFMQGASLAQSLDRAYIRERALGLYSMDVIGVLYERYFERLTSLHGEGWYATEETN